MQPDKKLIEQINDFCRANNMRVSEFALLCGLTAQTVNRVLSGGNVRLSSVLLIERTLGKSPEECSKIIAEATTKNRHTLRAKHAEYYRRNRDAICKYQRDYDKRCRREHPEQAREKDRRRRENNREYIRAYNREYQQKRRARLKAQAAINGDPAGASVTPEYNGSEAPARTASDD